MVLELCVSADCGYFLLVFNALCVCSGPVVRVLLFNATGERDCAAMLKLLVVSYFTVFNHINSR